MVAKSPVAPCLAHLNIAVLRQPFTLVFNLFFSKFTVRIIGIIWYVGTKGYKVQVMCHFRNFQTFKALFVWEAPVPGGTMV